GLADHGPGVDGGAGDIPDGRQPSRPRRPSAARPGYRGGGRRSAGRETAGRAGAAGGGTRDRRAGPGPAGRSCVADRRRLHAGRSAAEPSGRGGALNAYARSLPALGFDPAPGDVDLTRNLARQHSLVAQEARQVLALVERLNLSALHGRAADALRTVQGTFPPALRNTAGAAESLEAAASSWANQLSGFQAEADALERQAAAATAQQQALRARQAALPPGTVILTDDLQTASATVTGIHGQA